MIAAIFAVIVEIVIMFMVLGFVVTVTAVLLWKLVKILFKPVLYMVVLAFLLLFLYHFFTEDGGQVAPSTEVETPAEFSNGDAIAI